MGAQLRQMIWCRWTAAWLTSAKEHVSVLSAATDPEWCAVGDGGLLLFGSLSLFLIDRKAHICIVSHPWIMGKDCSTTGRHRNRMADFPALTRKYDPVAQQYGMFGDQLLR